MRRNTVPLHVRMMQSEAVMSKVIIDYAIIQQVLTDADDEGRFAFDLATVADLAEHAGLSKTRVEEIATAMRHKECREAIGGFAFGKCPEDLCWRSSSTNAAVLKNYTGRVSRRMIGEAACMEGVLSQAELDRSKHLTEIEQHVASAVEVVSAPRNLLTSGDGRIIARIIAREDDMLYVDPVDGDGTTKIPMSHKAVRRRFKQLGAAVGDTIAITCTGIKDRQRMYSFEAAA